MGEQLRVRLSIGSCQEVLKDVPDCTYDTIITDPPYGLGQEPDVVELFRAWVQGEEVNAGRGFLGNTWDQVPPPFVFREIWRVLKPSKEPNGVFFAGTRTLHLMTASLRMAGFDIEGVEAWVYSQGFPKSLNIYKRIQRLAEQRYGQRRCTCGDKEDGDEGHAVYDKEGGLDLERENPRKIVLDINNNEDNKKIRARVCSWCALPDPSFIEGTRGLYTGLKPAWEPVIIARKGEDNCPHVIEDKLLREYGFTTAEIAQIRTPYGKESRSDEE